jgi:hypothetical protein
VMSIGYAAFLRCSSLISIEIPSSVTSIGDQAFCECSDLTSVKVDWETPISISSNVFSFSNRANAVLYVPSGSKAAYEAANYWKEFKEIVENSNITFADANVKALCVANWDANLDGEISLYEAATVTDLGEVFKNNTSITSFNELSYFIGLESISDDAFWGCSNLNSIVIPDNVRRIGDRAFVNCGLTSIMIPKSVDYIGIGIGSCSGLSSIVVDEDNPVYDSRNGCNAIIKSETNELISGCKTTVIPSTVTSIAQYAFGNNKELTSIVIPNSVQAIGRQAFMNCDGLNTISLPGHIILGLHSFYDCDNLEKIYISNLSDWCSSDKDEWIVAKNTYPGYKLYVDNVEVNDLIIPNTITSVGEESFTYCGSITSVTIPSSMNEIKSWSFYGCKNLESVSIPNTITSIGIQAFEGCASLTSITIPSSVNSIGEKAFNECSGLTSVVIERTRPISIDSYCFSNRTNATLFVPVGSTAAYEAADYWNEFKEIVEYDINVEITMGSSGEATYSSNFDLDFTDVEGLKAYIASGFSPSTGKTTMTRVFKVPAGEGLYLKGEPGSYDIPSVSVDDIYANLLVGVPTATIVSPTDGEYTNLILTKKEGVIAFRELEETGTIASGKAYLHIPTTAYAACSRIYLVFEDEEEEAMGINSLNDKSEMMNDKAVYDLQGRRVENPTRGLYIKDGKKFIKK